MSLQNETTPLWYVIHTYSGYENKVATNIEKIVENRGLQNMIFDVRIPTETVVEKTEKEEKEIERKLFPSYVLVKMVMNDESWHVVRNIRGVTGFVGPQGKAVPLTEEEIKKMRLEDKVEHFDFAEGDSVRIVSGPLDSFIGVIESLDVANQKAKVKVSMFGRETEVELDFVQLDKLGVIDTL